MSIRLLPSLTTDLPEDRPVAGSRVVAALRCRALIDAFFKKAWQKSRPLGGLRGNCAFTALGAGTWQKSRLQTERPQTARSGGTGAEPLSRATARQSHSTQDPTRHRSNRRMDCEARSGFATSTVQECTPVLDCTGAGARREIARKPPPPPPDPPKTYITSFSPSAIKRMGMGLAAKATFSPAAFAPAILPLATASMYKLKHLPLN